jgi:hypothetical protein
LVALASRQGRIGADASSLRLAVREHTLGIVIFQSVFFIFCKPESRDCMFMMEGYRREKVKHSFEFLPGILCCQ